MITTEWHSPFHLAQIKEFSTALHDLAQRMPMELVRLYETEGVRTPRVRDRLPLRRKRETPVPRGVTLAEMRHVEAQAECWLEEHPRRGRPRIAAEHPPQARRRCFGHRRRQRRQPRIRLHA